MRATNGLRASISNVSGLVVISLCKEPHFIVPVNSLISMTFDTLRASCGAVYCNRYCLWEGVCGGAKSFGSALLQPARSVCVSPSAFIILLVASAKEVMFSPALLS